MSHNKWGPNSVPLWALCLCVAPIQFLRNCVGEKLPAVQTGRRHEGLKGQRTQFAYPDTFLQRYTVHGFIHVHTEDSAPVMIKQQGVTQKITHGLPVVWTGDCSNTFYILLRNLSQRHGYNVHCSASSLFESWLISDKWPVEFEQNFLMTCSVLLGFVFWSRTLVR